MKNIVVSTLFTFFYLSVNCQKDYKEYYNSIDSILYFKIIGNPSKIDQLYTFCFDNFNGFPDDYCDAIENRFNLTKTIDFNLITSAFKVGTPTREIIFTLKSLNTDFNKSKIRKIHRKIKLKKKTGRFAIYRLLFKDQFCRSLNSKKTTKIDSLNSIKLKELMIHQPELFNRFSTGYYTSQALEILLIHQKWENIQSFQKELIELTKEGLINRNILASIIDRNALDQHFVFKLDSLKSKIIGIQTPFISYCAINKGYSNIVYKYGRINDYVEKKVILPPLNPLLTTQEVNELRAFLFLSDLSLILKSGSYILPSPEMYCDYLNRKKNY